MCGGSISASEGFFEAAEEVDIIERKFVIKKHRRQKYKCACGSCIKTAPGPLKRFDGPRYSTNFAFHVAINKYADHLPLERQVRGMKRAGLICDSQTLWDQLERLAACSILSVIQDVCGRALSFNYDTVVEDIACHRGIHVLGVEDQGDSQGLPTLIKLHGSVDWSSTGDGYQRDRGTIARPPAIATPGRRARAA